MTRRLPRKDVVIIGLGWTGSIMANELTDEGLEVIAIERGPWRDAPTDFPATRAIDVHIPKQDEPNRSSDPQLGRVHAAEWRRRWRCALERRDVAFPADRFRAQDTSDGKIWRLLSSRGHDHPGLGNYLRRTRAVLRSLRTFVRNVGHRR